MVKKEVEYKMMSRDEMEELLVRFGVTGLQEYRTLFGGYSGSNYKVDADGFTGCLKVCNGYNKAEVSGPGQVFVVTPRAPQVEEQAAFQAYLSLVGFEVPCPSSFAVLARLSES